MKATKLLSLVLALTLCVSLVACGGKAGNKSGNSAGDEVEEFDLEAYTQLSEGLYDAQLGEFKAAYAVAKAEKNVAKRYALMAIAEAKLLESGVMLPTTTRGGNYAITRVAPYTVDYALWGNDAQRFHNALVVKGAPLAKEDVAHLRALYDEKKGTGTYWAEAKAYLEGKGREFTDEYNYSYSSDPQTWDALATSRAADSEAIVNTYDGLMEYDNEGIQQLKLAESYTVSEDGLKYTFKIRSDATWVNSQGQKVADVKADDFVAAFQHVLDADGGLNWLLEPVIKGVAEYLEDATKDFSQVGVYADDEANTVTYELLEETPYFLTMLGYNIFAPMNRSFYQSKGGKFGAEYNASAEDYTYGNSPEDIAYCGPYVVTQNDSEATIKFEAWEGYYDYANLKIHTITWKYNDGSDSKKSYNDMKAETLTGAGLNADALALAQTEKVEGSELTWFEAYGYVSNTDATSFMAFFNINRMQYSNINDGAALSPMNAAAKAITDLAMLNVHFRRAVMFSLDRAGYNAQSVGDDLKYNSMRNSYTPGTFVSLPEAATVSINGEEKTYPAGTSYGEIMQDQLDADGVKITAWTNENVFGSYSSDGFDGWYNADNALEELEAAIEYFEAAGFAFERNDDGSIAKMYKADDEKKAAVKIQLDLPVYTGSPIYYNRGLAFKQSVEAILGSIVTVNLVGCATSGQWYYAGYYTDYGYEANYSIYDVSGWGPDYGDPSSYLDTFLGDYAGYMVKCIGIF